LRQLAASEQSAILQVFNAQLLKIEEIIVPARNLPLPGRAK
jgi:hypothetical protein